MRQSAKNAPAEPAAHQIATVFSCGQLAKWVKGRSMVTGCEIELAARYSHAAEAYSHTVCSAAMATARALLTRRSVHALATGTMTVYCTRKVDGVDRGRRGAARI